jgi:hypothetical protein
MPASKRQPAGPSDPHLALAKAILQLKLKTASLKTDGSSKALRECIKAAGEVDGCLGILEAGPSLLQLALSQVRTASEPRGRATMPIRMHCACQLHTPIYKQHFQPDALPCLARPTHHQQPSLRTKPGSCHQMLPASWSHCPDALTCQRRQPGNCFGQSCVCCCG